MNRIILITTLLFSSIIWAQDTTNVKIETPHIITKLSYGQTLNHGVVNIKFIEVLQDSRCPKNVNCVWAGEVVVLVDIFENGKKSDQKKLTLSPTSHLQNLLGNLFTSEAVTITGFNVLPYPVSGVKTKVEDYYIQLDIRKPIE